MKLPIATTGRTTAWIIVILVTSAIAALIVTWRVPSLSMVARDALARARGAIKPPDEIIIVAIDEASIKRFGRFPWPRSLMARAIDNLSAAHPKVIALNILYTDPTNAADDSLLAEAVQRSGRTIVAAQLAEAPARGAAWLRPLVPIERAAAGIGHGNVLTDFDGVARSLTLREADDEGNALWAMAVEAVRVGDGLKPDEVRDVPEAVKIGSRSIPITAESPTLTFSTPEQKNLPQTFPANRMMIDYIGPGGSFADSTISIADVIDGRADPQTLHGRYVLVGATATVMGDRVASPFTGFTTGNGDQHGSLMPGVEVLANAVTTILHSRFYTQTPDWMAALVAVLVAAAIIGVLSLTQGSYEVLRQSTAIAGTLFLILGFSYFVFVRWLIIPPLVPSIISLLVATPLSLWLRSMTVSASLDERIIEMTRESAHLSPLVIDQESITARPLWWPRGTARKARDIAALQNRLLARTQFIDRALQSVEDGLLITDPTGRIAFANPGATKVFGLPESSLLGSNLFERLSAAESGPDRLDQDRMERTKGEALSQLISDRLTIEREIAICTTAPRYYLLRITAVRDNAGQTLVGIVATFSDITKPRELQTMQNDVMALVTHEMKTPLTAIKGMCEVMMKFELDTEKRQSMLTTINEASQRLIGMVEDYLELTRLESGARQLRLAFHRIEPLIERELLLLDPIADRSGIKIVRRLDPSLPPVLADAELVSLAMTNLVSNAIKYSPPDTEVVVSTRAVDDDLFIAVSDQGHGIPYEYRTKIFEKFFRVPRAEDADVPGTGLGLALVREIAELHGGRVTVESQTHAGSTFTLRLPIRSGTGSAAL